MPSKHWDVKRCFLEKVSGVSKERPEFQKLQNHLRSGDTVVVWDISRLGRSTIEMIKIVEDWISRKISLKSIQEPFIDTTTDAGEMILKFFIVLAESERKRIVARTNSGLEAARARGRVGGRKAGLSPEAIEKAKKVARLYSSKELTTEDICTSMKISRATLYKYLRHEGVEISGWTVKKSLNI